MKIFLSHASEDRPIGEKVALALRGPGHDVFFDQTDLPAGGDFNSRIRAAVRESDIFAFLVTPDSVRPGRYTLTELKYAEEKWPSPKGRVLPVMAKPTPFSDIPAYLGAVTVLQPVGNLPAETQDSVEGLAAQLRPEESSKHALRPAKWVVRPALGAVLGVVALFIVATLISALVQAIRGEPDPLGDDDWIAGLWMTIGAVVGGMIAEYGSRARPFVNLLAGATCVTAIVGAAAAHLAGEAWREAAALALLYGTPIGAVMGLLIATIQLAWRWLHRT